MSKIFFLPVLVALFCQTAYAFSIEKNDTSKLKFEVDIEAQAFYQVRDNFTNCNVFKAHSDITSNLWGEPVKPRFDVVTDHPFNHTAFYSHVTSATSFDNKYSLFLDLLMEHRGMSYGFNDMNNIVLFPLYKFSYSNNYEVFNDSLKIDFKVGCFPNNQIHNGLKIYNIDTQGFNLSFDWKKFRLQFIDVADLSHGVGLELEEYHDLSISFNQTLETDRKFNIGFYISRNSINYLAEVLNFYDNKTYYNYGSFGKYAFSKNFNIYYQTELRSSPYVNLKENTALLLGCTFQHIFNKFSITLNPEFRYYGWMYNYGHKYDSINYRTDSKIGITKLQETYAKTVGRSLYPLMNYRNQFSQWAVYTDYQYQNIAGLELRTSLQYAFTENFSILAKIESCTLFKEFETNGENYFTYFFYTNSLIYKLAKQFSLSIELSNKAMNLDKHFQTFYMSTKPYLGFTFRKEFSRNDDFQR